MNFYFFLLFIFQISCSSSLIEPDLNSFKVYLTKYSNKALLKSCDNDQINEPCSISVNYDAEILSEENINDYLYSNFLFANQTELVRKQKIESRTTLRRFLKQLDEYLDETTLDMEMPQFLRL